MKQLFLLMITTNLTNTYAFNTSDYTLTKSFQVRGWNAAYLCGLKPENVHMEKENIQRDAELLCGPDEVEVINFDKNVTCSHPVNYTSTGTLSFNCKR